MIIKPADSKTKDIETLEALILHPVATREQKRQIEFEIRTMKSGIKGESDAAYELDFNFDASNNWAILHDVRIEHAGHVAQIDHLAINRLLEIWVCESKRFIEGVSINEHGEFTAFYGGKPHGMSSPIEQNRKHCQLLGSLLGSGKVPLPKRLGMTMRPSLESVILVSKNARIGRPKSPVPGLDQVIKVDQFVAHMRKQMEKSSPLQIARLIGSDTLMDLAHDLADLHRPIEFNWAGKFGLSPPAPQPVQPPVMKVSEASNTCQAEGCEKKVSVAVMKFCQGRPARFDGKVYCMVCQKKV